MAHFANYQVEGASMDLSTSIWCYREALKLRHSDHPDRPATLLYLAQALLSHYERQGSEESTPGEITKLATEVQAICSVDSHERRAADLVLQTWALCTAITSNSLADVNKLIPTLRQAVQDIPHDYFDKPQKLSNLGLALRLRYGLFGDPTDLDEAIATYKRAIQFTPCGQPYKSVILSNLVDMLIERSKVRATMNLWEDALKDADEVYFVLRVVDDISDRVCRRSNSTRHLIEATSRGMQYYMGRDVMRMPLKSLIECYQNPSCPLLASARLW